MVLKHAIIFLVGRAFGAPNPIFQPMKKPISLEPQVKVPREDLITDVVHSYSNSYTAMDMKSLTVFYEDADKIIIKGFQFRMKWFTSSLV
jgi:hypothetical protein